MGGAVIPRQTFQTGRKQIPRQVMAARPVVSTGQTPFAGRSRRQYNAITNVYQASPDATHVARSRDLPIQGRSFAAGNPLRHSRGNHELLMSQRISHRCRLPFAPVTLPTAETLPAIGDRESTQPKTANIPQSHTQKKVTYCSLVFDRVSVSTRRGRTKRYCPYILRRELVGCVRLPTLKSLTADDVKWVHAIADATGIFLSVLLR